MGCGNSQLPAGDGKATKGARGARPSIGNPGKKIEYKLPMLPEEVARVQQSWDSIRSKMKETGIKMFVK